MTKHKFRRPRGFLLRVAHAWLPLALSAAAARIQPPAHTVTLHSPQLEVILNRDSGLPLEYRLLSNQAVIHGENSGRPVAATVFRSDPHQFAKVTPQPQGGKFTATRADFPLSR